MKDIPEAELKRFPVEQVSWDDAQLFLRQFNKQVKQEGWVYRLPKEVEWEYACRGGPMTDKLDSAFDFYFDRPVAQLQADQANFQLSGAKADMQGRQLQAEPAGSVRYARQCLGVVRRPIRPKRPDVGHAPGDPGRRLVLRRRLLPGGHPQRHRAGHPVPLLGLRWPEFPSAQWASKGTPRPAQAEGWSRSERSERGGSRRAGAGRGRRKVG